MDESQQSSRLRVTDAIFIPPEASEGRFSLHVYGENFLDRAVPLLARLGEQWVAGVIVEADGRSFAGTLERPPQAGDRLFVGYADAALQSTDVVYGGSGEPGPLVS
jgi:hypothetical protein